VTVTAKVFATDVVKTQASQITQKASAGVVVRQTGNYVVKKVDRTAGGLAQWYGRTSLNAQAAALTKLNGMAPNFLYKNGKLIMGYAGGYDGGFIRTWLQGSWRLGTVVNDIRFRNIGAAGKIFDPVFAPVMDFAVFTAAGLMSSVAKLWKYPVNNP